MMWIIWIGTEDIMDSIVGKLTTLSMLWMFGQDMKPWCTYDVADTDAWEVGKKNCRKPMSRMSPYWISLVVVGKPSALRPLL